MVTDNTLPAPIDFSADSLSKRGGAAHLVGIGGAGMKSLAELLGDAGWTVTGSDLDEYTLSAMRDRGLRVFDGHDDANLPESLDLLIHSFAVDGSNPEREAAARKGIPQLSYSEAIGSLMRSRTGVVVAGTHGKSTTAAMTALILRHADLDPSAAIGAALKHPAGPRPLGWYGTGSKFVAEGCEYGSNFLSLHPTYAAVLNVEHDHPDCFASFDEVRSAFAAFVAQVSADGAVVLNADDSNCAALAREAQCRVVNISNRPHSGLWMGDIRPTPEGQRFRVFEGDRFLGEIPLQVPGEHNAFNALAALALSLECDVPFATSREALWGFEGLSRRFEVRGSWRGRILIDDYAHHPTAVAAAIRTARVMYPERRVWAIMEPHQVSRLDMFCDDFATALSAADEVIVAPVFRARESDSDAALSAERLVSQINRSGTAGCLIESLDRIVTTLDDATAPGDVLLTLGAGTIDRVHDAISRRLRRHHVAG
ncbi:UDP-N-acetylmuramate--L-alanine ligase [Stratiformator vulcanicus]|uniref:UDP-N-acetylmuramate--L-alanine ligase n=1 Tax=Stratiformator vulcanicus TaxID=2527980 RepID=A0A517R0L6_9PLAN|nr:UDP-N-acetylmuramate--L-alanine ligase [Stratiformator vulcanicus]QDT37370.1 UDP-N-acetylmuramate--L-alanine ligase MurC [Stratiformator vulcanicus]